MKINENEMKLILKGLKIMGQSNSNGSAQNSSLNNQLLKSFQTMNTILYQVANMTLKKLSLNQELAIESSAMQMNFKKTNATNFKNYLKTSQGSISVPTSLCDSFRMDTISCSNNLITSQVSFKIFISTVSLIL
jgi:hypothetical protein